MRSPEGPGSAGADRHGPGGPCGTLPIAGVAAALALLLLAPLAMPASYSWIELGTSESAAQGVEGAWVARTGFVAFGLSVLAITLQRRQAWEPAGTSLHAVFGTSMVMVAVYSHAPWEPGVPYVGLEDQLHSVFASLVGFSFVAGVATVAVRRQPRTRGRALGDAGALVVALGVPLLMDTPWWGLLQRSMFVVAGLWYAAECWRGSRRHGEP